MPCKFVHLSSLLLGSVTWFPLVIGMLSNIAQAEAGSTLRDCSMSLSRCTCWDHSVNKPETACWRLWSHVERTELPDGRESTARHVREAFWEQQAPNRLAQSWSHIGLNKCSRTEVMLQSLNVLPASTWTIFGNIPMAEGSHITESRMSGAFWDQQVLFLSDLHCHHISVLLCSGWRRVLCGWA